MTEPPAPGYLAAVPEGLRRCGTATYDADAKEWIVRAEPDVMQTVKRLLPGSVSRSGGLRFPATPRTIGDLNWVMLRYPLTVEPADEFARQLAAATALAARREGNMALPQPAVPPTFTGKLYPFQAEAVSFLLSNHRTLLADDTGLGKTISALASAATAQAFPCVVVCEPNVTEQWVEMVGNFLDLPATQTALPATRGRDDDAFDRGARMATLIQGLKPSPLPATPIYVLHYGLLNAWLDELLAQKPRVVVFDEAQNLRHLGTKKYSSASLLSEASDYAWALSGTPIFNLGDEIWNVTNAIETHCLGDRDGFTREWCIGYGARQVQDPVALGAHLRREGLMLRRTEAEELKFLPTVRNVVHPVGADGDAYHRLIRDAVRLADRYDDIKDWASRGHAMAEIERETRKATGVAKAPYAAAFVRSLLDAGDRVLCFAWHHSVHALLAAELADYKPVRITGEEAPRVKRANVKAFGRGDTNLALISLRSSAGIDGLQGRATCAVFAELDWSPAAHKQAVGRIRRLGVDPALKEVMAYYLTAGEFGMDGTMMEALGLKIGQFVGIMGDKPRSADDDALAGRAAERHMDRVITQLKAMA